MQIIARKLKLRGLLLHVVQLESALRKSIILIKIQRSLLIVFARPPSLSLIRPAQEIVD